MGHPSEGGLLYHSKLLRTLWYWAVSRLLSRLCAGMSALHIAKQFEGCVCPASIRIATSSWRFHLQRQCWKEIQKTITKYLYSRIYLLIQLELQLYYWCHTQWKTLHCSYKQVKCFICEKWKTKLGQSKQAEWRTGVMFQITEQGVTPRLVILTL
jgi:hypothetical protein